LRTSISRALPVLFSAKIVPPAPLDILRRHDGETGDRFRRSCFKSNPSAKREGCADRVSNSEVTSSMSGMPLVEALVFLAVVVILLFATRRIHPFLAIVVVAAAFGLVCGFSISFLGKAFGTGFAEMIYSPGLVIVAAGFIAALADVGAASNRLTAIIQHRPWLAGNRIAAFLGLIAGIGASPAMAFALLTPLLPVIGGTAPRERPGTTTVLALAISASHGLVLFSPIPIAAVSILGADWGRVALFGLPLAALLAGLSAFAVGWLANHGAASPPFSQPASDEIHTGPARQGIWTAIVLVLAIAIPLLLLMEQSIGYMPSEPLGGGTSRELVLGVGRPLILFLIGVGIMAIGNGRHGIKLLGDSAWTARVLANPASVLLVVCAAGGLQRLCQETGMAELLGERLSNWHVGSYGAVLIPFLVAAAIKALQGSSLVAAIATAGMVQPLLVSLGLNDANGKALAALAVGAGAMTLSHINDEYFWLVTDRAGLTPPRGLVTLSAGTLVQGLFAVALLVILSLLVPRM
jgi:GntP family gluconate:H+ symporter